MAPALLERTDTDTALGIDTKGNDLICEASPQGKDCWRRAEFSAMITPHGCRRDNKMILMCRQCFRQIQGGQSCAFHEDVTIFIVRAVEL